MARLPQRGRRMLEQIHLLAADASSAELLAGRALAAIEAAVPFDEGAVFAVDSTSLVFDRLLAYRGEDEQGLRDWIRDVYLVSREPEALHFPTLLARGGGVAVYHELAERWLRAPPPAVSQRMLRAAWRLWDSPPGGVVRYGLAHRRRWIAALQLARLEPGWGFRPGEIEMFDRAAPTLAGALAAHLAARPDVGPAPPPGQLTFDYSRRLVSLSASGEQWLHRLAGPDAVPVAAQALVSALAGSDQAAARLRTVDREGRRVVLHAERAVHLDREVSTGYAVSVASAALDESDLTGAQWAVAQAVARGLSDREAAAELHLSPATIHEHVAALHRLLGTSTRPRLVAELNGALGPAQM